MANDVPFVRGKCQILAKLGRARAHQRARKPLEVLTPRRSHHAHGPGRAGRIRDGRLRRNSERSVERGICHENELRRNGGSELVHQKANRGGQIVASRPTHDTTTRKDVPLRARTSAGPKTHGRARLVVLIAQAHAADLEIAPLQTQNARSEASCRPDGRTNCTLVRPPARSDFRRFHPERRAVGGASAELAR
jgi:hypothetical protein